ncbi:MAG: hypothetical protein CMD22_00345 [Flavobacteriales bacterium]|nr:hypothetical protein [Flavobacteriales bacterium]|tara:strand:+ start:4752 stop:5681 length:930 start_codon:yes stop_codon:yes gene_type:complete
MKKILLLLLCVFCFVSCKKDLAVEVCVESVVSLDTTISNHNVLIVGIDGFRSDALTEDITPFMYNLSSRDDVYFTPFHNTEEDTYSGPNWSSLLTGVHYSKHNVVDNSFVGSRFSTYPPFQYYLELAYQQINTSSITNWNPINTYIHHQYLDYTSASTLNDSMVFQSSRDLLIEGYPIDPDVLFLQFDELDAAGHSFGFSPEVSEYVSTLSKIDVFVESLFNIIEEKRNNLGEDWLFFIVSDHGGDGTGHGDAENPHINQTIFFSQHPDLSFKPNYITNQTDLAPTILDYMGVDSEEIDCKMDGISIIE